MNKAFTILALLALTAALILFTTRVQSSAASGVRESLPETVPPNWRGFDVLFCQRMSCGRSWLSRDLLPNEDGETTCPRNWRGEPCGGELMTMSLGERLSLPEDTLLLKKQYLSSGASPDSVFVSVVFSGRHRSSIHRPEVCMVGQGHTIEKSTVIEVPLAGRDPLKVMVLHLSKRISPHRLHRSYYAYWFVGKDRETPFHHERMFWMSLDRVFKNITHRWAYIAVSGDRDAELNHTDHFDEIREVVRGLYPQITLVDPAS